MVKNATTSSSTSNMNSKSNNNGSSSSNMNSNKKSKNDDNDDEDDDLEDETPLQRAQRRELRKEQRKLLDSVHDNFEKIADKNSSTFDDLRQETNRLFGLANKTREQHNDALIFQQLSKGLKKMTASTSNLSARYNFSGFKDKLWEQYEDKELERFKSINWVVLGEDVGSFMRTPGNVTTFFGPLLREEKVRKESQRTKKREDDVIELRPEELIHDEEDDINEATNERFKILEGILKKNLNSFTETNDVEINNLIKILVDPTSSVQTIENFFDFSFMIKNKKARIFEHKSCTGLLGAMLDDEVGDEANEKNQAVLSMNMKHLGHLQELMKTVYPSHKCPLHRDDELYRYDYHYYHYYCLY